MYGFKNKNYYRDLELLQFFFQKYSIQFTVIKSLRSTQRDTMMSRPYLLTKNLQYLRGKLKAEDQTRVFQKRLLICYIEEEPVLFLGPSSTTGQNCIAVQLMTCKRCGRSSMITLRGIWEKASENEKTEGNTHFRWS